MWTLEQRAAIPVWCWRSATTGPILAFSTRRGGVSDGPFESLNLGRSTADRPQAVEENRRRFLTALGLAPESLANAGQVHGAQVVRASSPGLHPECDALVTTTRGLALAVTGADCLPILYVAAGAVGVAHAGWRGTAAGVPEAALAAVCAAAGAAPDDVSIHFGPCIRVCCYEVGSDVAARFPADVLSGHGPTSKLDLPGAARRRLLAAGASPQALHDTAACTACDEHHYFSHRRDRGTTGRQWGVVALGA